MLHHRNTELQIVKLANLVLMLNMVSKEKRQHCGIADVNDVIVIGVADDIADADVVDVGDASDVVDVSDVSDVSGVSDVNDFVGVVDVVDVCENDEFVPGSQRRVTIGQHLIVGRLRRSSSF